MSLRIRIARRTMLDRFAMFEQLGWYERHFRGVPDQPVFACARLVIDLAPCLTPGRDHVAAPGANVDPAPYPVGLPEKPCVDPIGDSKVYVPPATGGDDAN